MASMASPRHAYTVDEPDDTGDVGSDRSNSMDGSEQFRFSMADMEAYLHVLQTCLLYTSPSPRD